MGALDGFSEAERMPVHEMPQLERWVLHRLAELDGQVRRAVDDFQFHALIAELHNFCAVDLSAFYFDIRKDSLYCDHPADERRRAARSVMDVLFTCLTRWLAPILCFTAEEAFLARHPDENASIHLDTFPDVPGTWRDDALAERWKTIRDIRRVVTGALEVERGAKRIGSSLQAAPLLHIPAAYAHLLAGLDMAEIAIHLGIGVVVGSAPDGTFTLAGCGRCRRAVPSRRRRKMPTLLESAAGGRTAWSRRCLRSLRRRCGSFGSVVFFSRHPAQVQGPARI